MKDRVNEVIARFERFREKHKGKARVYYSARLKRLAVELYRESDDSLSSTASLLGVSSGALKNWCQLIDQSVDEEVLPPQRLEIMDDARSDNIAVFVLPASSVNSGFLEQIKAML